MSVCIAIDFETSAYRGDRACAVGMARFVDCREAGVYYSLIRPPSSRVLFSHVHGLTWAVLREARPFAQVWQEAADFVKGADFFIAHNARFDQSVLADSCVANGLAAPDMPFLCTLRGARKALRLPGYGLAAVAAHLGIQLTHHHAGSDALACGKVYARLRQGGLSEASMRLPGANSYGGKRG